MARLKRLGWLGVLLLVALWPSWSAAVNNAVFISQNVPSTVGRGAQFSVEITMQNTGDDPWTLSTGYFLGSENPRDNFTWGTNRIWLDPNDSVAPGASHTFTATLTAPAQEGEYDFQWQMLQDAVEWFGEPSQNLRIQVTAPQFTCDGTEVLCLQLTSQAEVTASGGAVVGGDFNAAGFMPSNQGGIDWEFGAERDFSAGEMEVTVTGLQPLPGGELEGGKVSIFAMCGLAPYDNEGVGIQKMAEDYRDGHIFRYGMDDDGLADNWDAVIITGAGFGCYYSINDPPWQAGESHYIRATWSSAGLELWIDDTHCSSGGNGDTFDPIGKVFTLANRCTHYANQQAIARFSNLKLWARGTSLCGNGQIDAGETCDGSCPTSCDDGDPCTIDTLTGDPARCNVNCQYPQVTACAAGDSCCPAGCDHATDADCPDNCGNGQLDPGETCDGDCPTSCEDSDACTADTLHGSAGSCNVTCENAPITACAAGDGCCPAGCTEADDADCSTDCGNDRLDPGETCDGNCPTSCDDQEACTTDSKTGDSSTCDVACSNVPITACAHGDGCCPSSCSLDTDDDCSDQTEDVNGGCSCGADQGPPTAWLGLLALLAAIWQGIRRCPWI